MIQERYTIKNELQKDEGHTFYEAYDEIFHREVYLFATDDLMHMHEMVERIFKEQSIFYYYTVFIEHTTVYYVMKGTPRLTCVKALKLDDQGLSKLLDGIKALMNSYHKKGIYFKHLSLEWLYVDEQGRYNLLLPSAEVNTMNQERGLVELARELYALTTGQSKVTKEGLDYLKAHYSSEVCERLIKNI